MERNGLDLFRLLISALHELFVLIKENSKVLDHPFLSRVTKHLPNESRHSWQALVTVARDESPKDEFGRWLIRIRNQIVFHYDSKAIYNGYKRQFLHIESLQDRAYISRGLSMKASRFYFADAAAEGYFREIVGENEFDKLLLKVRETVKAVNEALLGLVDQFIQQRGFAYRKA